MRTRKNRGQFLHCICLSILGVVFLVGGAGAQDRTFFLGVSLHYSTLGGSNFDGNHSLEAPGQFIPMPKFKAALGYEAVVGVLKENWGLEFTFNVSPHKAEIFDPRDNIMGSASRNVSISTVSLNYLFFPRLIKNIKLFLLAGVGYCWFTIDDSFFEEDIFIKLYPPYPYKANGDSLYRGLSFNAGSGVLVPLGSRLSFTRNPLQVAPRLAAGRNACLSEGVIRGTGKSPLST